MTGDRPIIMHLVCTHSLAVPQLSFSELVVSL